MSQQDRPDDRGPPPQREARWVTRHALSVAFICVALCAGGIYAADHLPSSVFPRTDI